MNVFGENNTNPEIVISEDNQMLAYNNSIFGRQPYNSTWVDNRIGTAPPNTMTMEVWNLKNGSLDAKITSLEDGNHLVFSPKTDLLYSVNTTKLQIWNIKGSKMIREIRCPAWLMNLAVSPDGTLIASADLNGQAILWGIKK